MSTDLWNNIALAKSPQVRIVGPLSKLMGSATDLFAQKKNPKIFLVSSLLEILLMSN